MTEKTSPQSNSANSSGKDVSLPMTRVKTIMKSSPDVEQVSQEFETGQLERLHSHALLQAQAKTYVRHSQARLILSF